MSGSSIRARSRISRCRNVMKLSKLVLVAGLVVPLTASAQPADAPPPPPGDGSGSAASADDAKIKELVDRELAKVLSERAAAEAAERATKEQTEKETTTGTAGSSDITGGSGFMDTRLAFTITNENLLVKPGETIP